MRQSAYVHASVNGSENEFIGDQKSNGSPYTYGCAKIGVACYSSGFTIRNHAREYPTPTLLGFPNPLEARRFGSSGPI
ncbi:hypothetical protein EVAR_80103_1 [Eumeta japonica]|uniref:Uncharacterized protein n=1 Tax=Eumeta variegata TaxID=151549 RepID=A0A4C1UDP6_EUMVA|nr:hypothetical protein EVAR_80103_1 [Eumeta japonica]